jgi:hypothetical protein
VIRPFGENEDINHVGALKAFQRSNVFTAARVIVDESMLRIGSDQVWLRIACGTNIEAPQNLYLMAQEYASCLIITEQHGIHPFY